MPPTALLDRRRRVPARPAPGLGGPALQGSGLLVLLTGMALAVIDFFVVNVALPTMGRNLHASDAELQLVVAGYGVAYAVGLVLGGRLGDAVGRRRLFTAGIAAFTVTSALCGIAPGIGLLIAFRVLQGGAAALMVPQVLATIQAATEGRHRSAAISRYGATAGVGTVVGQLAGGVLLALDIAGLGWRPVFLVNVPIGIAVMVAARRVPDTRAQTPPGVDHRGTALLAGALVCLLVPLTEGRALHWPVWSWASLAAAPLLGALLWRTERRIERRGGAPLLPPMVVGMLSMRRGLSAAVPFFTGFGGFMFVYALVTQEGLHLGPLASGATIAPMAVAFFAASLLSPRAAARFGARIVAIGSAIQAAGLVLLALTVLHGWPHLALPVVFAELTVVGFGQGLVGPTLFRVVLADVPARVAGMGSGVLVTTQQASLALGAAVLGGVFLSLVPAVGMADAAAVVLGAQVVGSALVAVAGLRLPQLAPTTVSPASSRPQASTSSSATAGRPWAAATDA